MPFLRPSRLEDLLQALTAKGSGMSSVHVVRDAGEIGSHVILPASRKILKSQLILNGDDNASPGLYVGSDDAKEILKRRIASHVANAIFKNAGETDQVIVPVQLRLHVLEITQLDGHVITLTVAIGIDHAALLRELHAGNASGLSCQRSGNGAAPASYVQHLVRLFHGDPFHDVLPLL